MLARGADPNKDPALTLFYALTNNDKPTVEHLLAYGASLATACNLFVSQSTITEVETSKVKPHDSQFSELLTAPAALVTPYEKSICKIGYLELLKLAKKNQSAAYLEIVRRIIKDEITRPALVLNELLSLVR